MQIFTVHFGLKNPHSFRKYPRSERALQHVPHSSRPLASRVGDALADARPLAMRSPSPFSTGRRLRQAPCSPTRSVLSPSLPHWTASRSKLHFLCAGHRFVSSGGGFVGGGDGSVSGGGSPAPEQRKKAGVRARRPPCNLLRFSAHGVLPRAPRGRIRLRRLRPPCPTPAARPSTTPSVEPR